MASQPGEQAVGRSASVRAHGNAKLITFHGDVIAEMGVEVRARWFELMAHILNRKLAEASDDRARMIDEYVAKSRLLERFGIQGKRVNFRASAIQGSGKPTRTYDFLLEAGKGDVVRVKETAQVHLPAHCPTRHVDEGRWCCVGLDAGEKVLHREGAVAWWRKLEVFILCQETAINLGVWPPEMELSHGRAGEIQVIAENAAEERGLLNEYKQASRDHGQIFDAMRLLRRRESGKLPLVNGRAPCVCNSRDRRERLKLRRECWSAHDLCLVRLEMRRRELGKQFVDDLKVKGFKCCGTMKECPFRSD